MSSATATSSPKEGIKGPSGPSEYKINFQLLLSDHFFFPHITV